MTFKERMQQIRNNVAARRVGKWEHAELHEELISIDDEFKSLAESAEVFAKEGRLKMLVEGTLSVGKTAEEKFRLGRVLGRVLNILAEKKAKALRRRVNPCG